MNRLTERNKHGVAVIRPDATSLLERNPVARLADYEDTGLTPEEIIVLKTEIPALKETDRIERETLRRFDCLDMEALAAKYTQVKAELDEAVSVILNMFERDENGVLCCFCSPHSCTGEEGVCIPTWNGHRRGHQKGGEIQ